jgi:2-polyprenyl-3-methyl-5-hydroxy-6-metoxy-1,4-benzoquinol methylase
MTQSCAAPPPHASERATCYACGSRTVHAWRRARTSEPALAAREFYALDRCASCGSAWIANRDRLHESRALYAAGVYTDVRPRFDAALERLREFGDHDRLRFARRIRPGSRVFEVGIGDGRLFGALRRLGYRVSGNEPAESFAEALTASGVDVMRRPVEELQLDAASQDAVIMWHVLEHLDDPAFVMHRIREWLRSGGEVLIAVPNLASLQAAIGRDRWFHEDVPRHRTLFTLRGLQLLVRRCGFEVAEATSFVLDQSLLGMWQTLLNRFTVERNVLFRALKHQQTRPSDLALTVVAAPIFAPVAAVVEIGAGLAGHGGTAVVRARAR